MKKFSFLLMAIAFATISACSGNEGQTTDQASDLAQPTPVAGEPADGEDTDVGSQPEDREPTKQPGEEIADDSSAVISPDEPSEVVITAEDGLSIVSTFYPGSGDRPWPAVILLHMNGGDRSDWAGFASQLVQNGYAAMAVDMRGHGDTGGGKEWDKTATDLSLVFEYLANREDIDRSKIAVAGASIGANMALVLATEEPSLKTAILLSPGLDYFGVTTDDRILEYGNRPILLVASQEDRQAADSSSELQRHAAGEAELILYENAGHGTNMLRNQPTLAMRMVSWFDRFVKENVSTQIDPMSRSTLLGVAWDDRSPFRSGLISEEASVLDQLPGATVYHMDLEISPDLYSVSGRQEFRYTNQENISLDEIYFHLFPNILGGQIVVSEVAVNGQPAKSVQDRLGSIMSVSLPEPLQPGNQTIIAMTFEVVIPDEGGSNYGVFATVDDVLALAHFYPQVAVYDDEGWNIEPPPENADPTYADSSFYLVQLRAPADQIVVASGIAVHEEQIEDTQQLTIAAGPVRDFYLASSNRYVRRSQMFGETIINSYTYSEYSDQQTTALDIAGDALSSMGERLGPYPYTEFDIAPTPNLALGVEYPGMTVIRAELYDPAATIRDTPATFFLEGTIAHEVAHQWFYNIVGNDQLDEPWLDESLVQYLTMLYFGDVYGSEGRQGYRDSFISRWERVEKEEIPIGLPAGDYEGAEYGAIVYGRGALFFDKLEEELGADGMSAFLRAYYQENKWGIVEGNILKTVAEEHCSCDLTQLFADWIGDL